VEIGETLYAPTRREWRAWLRKHHKTAPDIWLVFHTKASGKPSLPYNDAVEEALCFGWIDSIVKKHGPDSRAQRFTPRRVKSALSPMNRERVVRLIAEKRMTPAGLAAAGDIDTRFVVPKDIERELRRDREVWANFQRFPESYKRIRIGWIDGARRRPDVFEQRLRYFIKKTKRNERFGMVQ
jgi:uncharacterized protein YdeI (YjbR/CyaY-like superfamily)